MGWGGGGIRPSQLTAELSDMNQKANVFIVNSNAEEIVNVLMWSQMK